MKITKRMKKILLFLSTEERKLEWVSRSSILLSCKGENSLARSKFISYERSRADFTVSELASHLRTLRILMKHDLIESKYGWGARKVVYLRLTDKGNKLTEEIKGDIRNLVAEYKELT